MKVRGDIEAINLSTGERWQRVTGEGDSRLEPVKPESEMNTVDELPKASPNDRGYTARANHTVAFAKLANAYAELYDRWTDMTSDIRRKREEADRQEKIAEDLKKQLDATARALEAQIVPDGGAVSR